MNADGSGKRQLTPSPAPCERSPDWSPDGQRILFVESAFLQVGDHQDIAAVGADGSGHALLVDSAGRFSPDDPVWSPDGRSIAFFSGAYYGKSQNGLFVLPAAGGDARSILTSGRGGLDWAAARAVAKPKPKKPPYCKKGQKPTKKKPCRKRR